jgi:hypothetical protein
MFCRMRLAIVVGLLLLLEPHAVAQQKVLTISPTAAAVSVGQSVSFKATGVTGTPKWTSSNPAVVTISATGLATGRAPGSVTIMARSGGRSVFATLQVIGTAPAPVDCVLSNWELTVTGAWTPEVCDASGVQTRLDTYERTVIVPAANGGLACEELLEVRPVTQACIYVPSTSPPPSGDSPFARNEHPRMGLTLDDLPAIAQRVSTGGEWHADFQAYVDDIEDTYAWNGTGSGDRATQLAFVYLLRTKAAITGVTFTRSAAQYGAEAAAVLVALSSRSFDEHLSMAFAYDWAHGALSTAQKTAIVSGWKAGLSPALGLYTFPGGGAWHVPIFSGTFAHYAEVCLAAKGDGIEEAWLQTGCDRFTWALHSTSDDSAGYFTKYTQLTGATGGCLLGPVYCLSYGRPRVAGAELAWRTAHGIVPATRFTAANNYLLHWAHSLLYTLRPMGYRKGDEPGGKAWMHVGYPAGGVEDSPNGESGPALALGFTRTQLQSTHPGHAALAAWLLENRVLNPTRLWHFTKFLAPKNAGRSPSALGIAGDFAGTIGTYQWRTGYESHKDALVNVFALDFFSSPGASNAGNFTIDYNGPAITYGQRGGHELDANKLASHNVMGFPDPSRTTLETGNEQWDDYGYPRSYYPGSFTAALTANSPLDTAKSDTARYRPSTLDGIGYLWIDNGRAYNGAEVCDQAWVGNTCKVQEYKRAFAYVPPSTPGVDSLLLVKFDFATTLSETFEHRDTYVFANDPTVDGSASPGPARNGSTARKTQYSGATTITHRLTDPNFSGENTTFLSPLLPLNRTIVKVAFRDWSGPQRQIEDSYGILRGDMASAAAELFPYFAWHRIEIIPSVRQPRNDSVTVIEVCPNTTCAKSPTTAISGPNAAGALVRYATGNYVFVHRPSDGADLSFVLSEPGTYRVLVAGVPLNAPRALVVGSNLSASGSLTASPQGTLTLMVVVSAAGTGVANTVAVR